MGVTSFLQSVEAANVKERRQNSLPENVALADAQSLLDFLRKDFTEWFLVRRDVLLAEEWGEQGWAERVVDATGDCQSMDSYRVKPCFGRKY